jgi:hypothetical protein
MEIQAGPVRVPMPDPVAAALEGLLRQVDPLWRRLDDLVVRPDPPGSAAQLDKGDKLGAMAYDLAATYLRAALDHVHAWRALFQTRVIPSFAQISLLRTAHEAALIAFWLMEPGVASNERRARGVAAQLADYDERRKLEEEMGVISVPPPARTGAQRHAELLTVAEQQGLTRRNTKGKPVLLVAFPSTVELFARYEPVPKDTKIKSGACLYRLYSGFAHGKQWAITQGAQRVTPFEGAGRALALASGVDTGTLLATDRTMSAIGRAIAAYEELRRGKNSD